MTDCDYRPSDHNADHYRRELEHTMIPNGSVTLSLTITHRDGFARRYELSDEEGIVAWSEFGSMLIYAFALEALGEGMLRAITQVAMVCEKDCHDLLRDEYFARFAEYRRVAQQARGAETSTVNLEDLGLL